ncbi:hypothetical protein Sipo8835_46600 [Streptomyces ipomoeae]|uniref:Uncharacterized protein n=1 Tax=Streptomyces ipomoeae TaxID=103232 RepID=A0AAE9AV22_9ACTN|nr:hypothetical protein [Streptomyces ipomoeae]TQE15108.1 hypothetical protein Sipo8835_46600 [Streptomyces ipomoeae]
MRPRTTRPATPRAWTVELRTRPNGLTLVCHQCPHGTGQVTAASARSAALAHLARHARSNLLPSHLRICQCHERGCNWHPRHRGCAGPIHLLLARERGGRVWRLADTCSACATATVQAAVVPDTVLVRPPQQPATARRRRRLPRGPGEHVRVREMLSYLAAALPPGTSAAARLLALQCALRMNATMQVRLPKGILRSLLLGNQGLLDELERARWLSITPTNAANEIAAELLDAALLGQAAARPDRMHAADWALRASSPPTTGTAGALLQLASLYLTAHTAPETGDGLSELDQMARACGIQPAELPDALDQLAMTGLLSSWTVYPDSGDLHWVLARRKGHPPETVAGEFRS